MISIRRNFSNQPGCIVTLIGIIFMVVALIFLAIAVNQLLQERKYQPGQCTITARQLQQELSSNTTTHRNGNNTYTTTTTTNVYAPYFEYTVHTFDGRIYPASGYNGSSTFTSDRVGQQAIVDRYSVGQSYQCWYNPARPTQAVLVRQANWLAFLLGGIFLLVGGIIAIVGVFMLMGFLFGSGGRSQRYSRRG